MIMVCCLAVCTTRFWLARSANCGQFSIRAYAWMFWEYVKVCLASDSQSSRIKTDILQGSDFRDVILRSLNPNPCQIFLNKSIHNPVNTGFIAMHFRANHPFQRNPRSSSIIISGQKSVCNLCHLRYYTRLCCLNNIQQANRLT